MYWSIIAPVHNAHTPPQRMSKLYGYCNRTHATPKLTQLKTCLFVWLTKSHDSKWQQTAFQVKTYRKGRVSTCYDLGATQTEGSVLKDYTLSHHVVSRY